MTTQTCPVCNKEFTDPKHPNRICCSVECAGIKRRRINRACETCGIEYKPTHTTQRYCSRACQPHTKDKTKWAVFTCQWCGKEFETWAYRNPTHCSSQCRSEYGARQPKLNARRPENFVTIICEVCGKEFTLHKAGVANGRVRVTCSKECSAKRHSENMMGSNHPRYKGGTSHPDRGSNWQSQKQRALKRDGRTCQICGKKPKKGQRWVIDVHHIMPYKLFNGDFLAANQLRNLITLCRRCHSQVEKGKLACPRPLF